MRIEKWNYNRDNTKFDAELEVRMLNEEAQEFKDGMSMLFSLEDVVPTEAQALDAMVELVDAWADYRFVLTGTKYKLLGADVKFDISQYEAQEKYMFDLLVGTIEISQGLLYKALEAVVEANEAKGTEKVNGKIQKGDSWVDPKDVIRKLLENA